MQHYMIDKVGNRFVFKKTDIHHIKDVMRFDDKDKVICIFDGKQYLSSLKFDGKEVYPVILEEIKKDSELKVDVTLIVGLPRLERFELVIQKATELGVSTIVPYICKRSIVKISPEQAEKKLQRWEKIAKEATEQSRRCKCPRIANIIDIKGIKDYLSQTNILAYEESEENILKKLLESTNESITFLVGPEGGFDKNEVKEYINMGFNSVSLGKRILKSESACIFLMSLASFNFD